MNAPLPWFRLYTEIVNDPKIRLLAYEDRWHFVALLCLKGGGMLDEEDAELRMNMVRITIGLSDADLGKMLDRLAKVRLIDRDTLQPLAWNRRQMKSDHDGNANDRKRLQREREKQRHEDVTRDTSVTSLTSHGDVTVSDTDTDTDKDKDKDKNIRAKRAVRVCPEEVEASVWDAFLQVRKAKNAPLTAVALEGIRREARKAGLGLGDALRMCCEKNWQGFDASWVAKSRAITGQRSAAI